MTHYTSWGSVFLFTANIFAERFHSDFLMAAFYIIAVVCFFLANRQEQRLFERITRLDSQLRAVTGKNRDSGVNP